MGKIATSSKTPAITGFGTMTNRQYLQWGFVRCVGFLMALLLFWSGSEHLKNPFAFLVSILRYRLIQGDAATLVASILPVIQTVLAGMLALGVTRRVTLFSAATLMSLFACVQLSAVLRGLEIGCGCFGAGSDTPVTIWSVARVATVAAVAWLSFFLEAMDRSVVVVQPGSAA
jgi:hypothetical protein